MDAIKLSVIICSHNPRREYLERTLAALKAQTLARDAWELIVVDNASKPAIAEAHDLSWHPRGRQVVETNLGVIHARQRGVAEMRGEWLVFVDDDNVLAEDYLSRALAIITAGHPRLALFGAGVMKPEFEISPPAELNGLLSMLALRDVAAPRRSSDPKESAAVPCGAGMCARRDIAGRFAALVAEINKLVVLGRKGNELFSHEDDIFSWAAAQLGMEFGVFPELRMTHLIGAKRLTQEYFLRLIYYHALTHSLLRYLMTGDRPRQAGLSGRLRLVPHVLRRGMFSARCQQKWMEGEDRAAGLIEQNGLKPLKV